MSIINRVGYIEELCKRHNLRVATMRITSGTDKAGFREYELDYNYSPFDLWTARKDWLTYGMHPDFVQELWFTDNFGKARPYLRISSVWIEE